jgi:hypothetical protein
VVKENELSDVKRNKVGKIGERFEFAHMSELGVKVEFAEGSLEKGDFEAIQRFMERIAK